MRLALFLALLLPETALACRYNVRDVGFVDLGAEPYHLYAFLAPDTPEAERDELESAAEDALRETNIRFELIDPAAPPTHPARVHQPPSLSEEARGPFAVLVSPDGPALPVPIRSAGSSLAEAARKSFAELASSPAREALVAATTRSFGVMFLIEGTDADANLRARKILAESIAQIRQHMASLPKAIAQHPLVVALEPSSLARERVLLWTLRQTTDPQPEPRVVVIYGRARWLGPIIRAAELSTRNVVGLFSIIGADCECGMDLAWTQGTRLPVRWPESLHAPLAQALGFDPENPLVKTEISSILSRRSSTPRPQDSDRLDAARAVPAVANTAASPTTPAPSQARTQPTPTMPASPRDARLPMIVVALAGLAALAVLVIGGWIALRGRRGG